MHKTLLSVAVVVALFGPSGAAQADLMPPNHHSQRVSIRLDFGAYADYAARRHVVVKGDTYQKIAKAHLGDMKRWTEIAKLNPKVKPTALPIGETLVLPPAKTPLAAGETETASGARHQWSFFALDSMRGSITPIEHDREVPAGRYGTEILALRQDKVALLLARADPGRGIRDLVKEWTNARSEWFARASGLKFGRASVPDKDPIHRIERHMRITGVSEGEIKLEEISARYLDKAGKELTAAEVEKAKSDWNFVLLFLGLVGVVGLMFVARRRAGVSVRPTA